MLSLPLLFAAGMSLVDTADGMMMLHAYDWAFVDPARRLRYNFWITLLSVLVALVVGGVELLSVIGPPTGTLGAAVDIFGSNFTTIGYLIIGMFGSIWLAAMIAHRIRRPSDDRALG